MRDFFYDFVLAFFAHVAVGDGDYFPVALAIIVLAISYFYNKKINV